MGLFLHPGFLLIAAALISVPIIIHLINRMRFKRVRWAAMEFLLKAQKRTRRRLIIEQLLLLLLRCFLISLVGLLVLRFRGCSNESQIGKANLHLVLLDDTLSMQDQFKEGTNTPKSCFDVAKDIIENKIARGLSLSKSGDKLMILPLSRLNDPPETIPVYENLNDSQRLEKVKEEISKLEPSMLHVDMLAGVKAAREIFTKYSDHMAILHVVSDFRQKDWSAQAGKEVYKELLEQVDKNQDTKVRLIDTALPVRAMQGIPHARDNVGIVDFRPTSRIIGKNMKVQFNVAIQNFGGAEQMVYLEARDETDGNDLRTVDFKPPNPISVKPSTVTYATFEHGFDPKIKAGKSHFAHLSVRLTNARKDPLDNDGLLGDNIRHTVVEVREQVPVLVIDGGGADSKKDGDSFIIETALRSVPGKSFDIVFGDKLGGGNPLKALERSPAELKRFSTIFLLNVREFDEKTKQRANLESYAREGGGVAFYLGPNVNAGYYNKFLYRNGEGIFPAPLIEVPTAGPKKSYELLVRDEKFSDLQHMPIFGNVISQANQRYLLRHLPIEHYYQVNRTAWKAEPGKVFELATLSNDEPGQVFQDAVLGITENVPKSPLNGILNNKDFEKFHKALQKHMRDLRELVNPGAAVQARAFDLAFQIDNMIADQPDLWNSGNADVQKLRFSLKALRDQLNYGDPFVVAREFNKGKVVAIMSTAGLEWNDWPGRGSMAGQLFEPFVWEMQNYLSNQGSEANWLVGETVELPPLDAAKFPGAELKLVRYFLKPNNNKAPERIFHSDQAPQVVDGQLTFSLTKNTRPGVYLSELVNVNAPQGTEPIAAFAHAFNVDSEREGPLDRASSDELDRDLVKKTKYEGSIRLITPGSPEDQFVAKANDFSESPWLFLIFLLVLVAEQALAVHLSFHLRGNENELTPAVRKPAAA